MMGGYGLMAGMGWWGILTMVLFWAGVIALIIWGVSALTTQRPMAAIPDALEVLRQRYARGEISQEEFIQARETLQS